MDLSYELRRRTNYISVDEFATEASDSTVQRFHDGFQYLTSSGLLLYETKLAQYVGLDVLAAAAQDWTTSMRRAGTWAGAALQGRLAAIHHAFNYPR